MVSQEGIIAFKQPHFYQSTLGARGDEAHFGIFPAQNYSELVGPPGSRTKEAGSPGDWHTSVFFMQFSDIKFIGLERSHLC